MPQNQTKRKTPQKSKPAISPPVILIIFGAVLVLSVLVYLAVSESQAPSASSGTSNSNSSIPYPEVERISLNEAKKVFDEKTAVFVDVRSEDSFQASHITGAINIPANEVESSLDKLDPQQWIITYCT